MMRAKDAETKEIAPALTEYFYPAGCITIKAASQADADTQFEALAKKEGDANI